MMKIHAWLLGAALTLTVAGAAEFEAEVPTLELRGYGRVSFRGEENDGVSLGVFQCESPERAKIVGSKYLADLQNYGAVEKVAGAPSTLRVRHGGLWKLGLAGDRVMVLVAPDAAALEAAAKRYGAEAWSPVPEQAYPRYLDNFDNAALALWWMCSTKSPEEMAWFAANPVIANLHYNDLSMAFAPGVFDNAGPRNAAAQLRKVGKPYRTMMWTGNGKETWYSWMNLPGDEHESYVSGYTGGALGEAAGYYSNQVTSELLNDLQLQAMAQLMERWKDDPNLLAWMEPHGEFQLFTLSRPPRAEVRFPEYLRTVRNYTLEELNRAWGTKFERWDQVKLPDPAYFQGRRGRWLDLDDVPWRWQRGSLAEGEQAGYARADFDDSGWFSGKRTDKRLLVFVQDHVHVPGAQTPPPDSLWARFGYEIPESFLRENPKLYLHVMPYSRKTSRNLAIWINGREVARNLVDAHNWASNEHSEVEISRFLKPGRNEFVIHSEGGRIAYRVFVSPLQGGVFPYAEAGLNRQFTDWRDYLRYEKFKTLETYLRAMRAIDPVRPIKVMTPHQWQSDAFDLFEQYGAYPQLTGETTWYRPMHYKGYTMLRNRLSSSEPGGFVRDARNGQHMYAMAFYESQDAHDYGFDFTRDFWQFKPVVEWWTRNAPLLATFGKTNLERTDLGLLRDVDQDIRYGTGLIWNWDLARGPLPALGLTPVLVDGADLKKGLADGRVKVLFDCATTVMDPELVEAVRRYVEQGGIFVAQHHTGQHTPDRRDAWPLARAFGLSVKPGAGNGEITFAADQDLFPSLRNRKCQGSGASIDHTGQEQTGQVAIQGPARAVATWSDHSMAIAEVSYGKGRFILLGTPFYLRFKDDHGKWLNEEARQAMLQELLASLGIERNTEVSEPAIWLEKRASKNGLYEVYFGGALGIRGNDWTLEDRIESELAVRRAAAAPAIEATAAGHPDVRTTFADGRLSLGKQQFSPYQIRQFAVVREHPGVNGPAHWLREQEKAWYALKGETGFDRERAAKTAADFARQLGEDGLDISKDWFVQLNTQTPGWIRGRVDGWAKADLGSWLEQGFPEDTNRVRYRKEVEIPADWLDGKSRIYLCFAGHPSVGLTDRGRLWLGGRQMGGNLSRDFRLEVPPDRIRNGRLSLAFEVTCARTPTKAMGPVGTMYLHKFPKPEATLELNGEWTRLKSVLENDGKITVPYRGRLFGISREFEVPADWQGKVIRLVIDEPADADRYRGRVGNAILNHEGYLRENSFAAPGVRVDAYLEPGKRNSLDLFGVFLNSKSELFNADLGGIRLEAYSLQP